MKPISCVKLGGNGALQHFQYLLNMSLVLFANGCAFWVSKEKHKVPSVKLCVCMCCSMLLSHRFFREFSMRMIHYRVKNVWNLLKMETTYLYLFFSLFCWKSPWNITPYLWHNTIFASQRAEKKRHRENMMGEKESGKEVRVQKWKSEWVNIPFDTIWFVIDSTHLIYSL